MAWKQREKIKNWIWNISLALKGIRILITFKPKKLQNFQNQLSKMTIFESFYRKSLFKINDFYVYIITYMSAALFPEIFVILNFISLNPPTGIRSLPVENNNNFRCIFMSKSCTASQKYLWRRKWFSIE